jgi:16S rRNA (cytidine1402-2'-O)-methyltransferase
MERAAGHDGTGQVAKPSLYVVATPIGNLRDVTQRALDVLRQADIIAAEDTRITTRLLRHYGIDGKQLIAVHEHNEQRSASRVIALLGEGRSVALVSDAGTPGFSDPGARLVSAVRAAGFAVVPVPGANAAIAALSASGLPAPHCLFYGFLPPKSGERRRALASLEPLPYLLLFYEAPHRVLETLRDLAQVLGRERRVVIARELTKVFETVHACSLGEAPEWLQAAPGRLKGEFVLIVEGQREEQAFGHEAMRTLMVLLESLPAGQAAALAAKLTGRTKDELYALALELKASHGGRSSGRS